MRPLRICDEDVVDDVDDGGVGDALFGDGDIGTTRFGWLSYLAASATMSM